MEKYLDITEPRYSEIFLPVAWFCYVTLYSAVYFGTDIVSRRLLQFCCNGLQGLKWIKTYRPATRYRTHSDQISTRLIQIMKLTKNVTLK